MNLTRKQKAVLIKTLWELGNGGVDIPLTVGEISSRLMEPLGRTVSDMTTRGYLRDCGFTWKENSRSSRSNKDRRDRIASLARIVEAIMLEIGMNNPALQNELHALATKQALVREEN